LAILTKISTAFENSISEYLHFQSLCATENGGASCPAGKQPMQVVWHDDVRQAVYGPPFLLVAHGLHQDSPDRQLGE